MVLSHLAFISKWKTSSVPVVIVFLMSQLCCTPLCFWPHDTLPLSVTRLWVVACWVISCVDLLSCCVCAFPSPSGVSFIPPTLSIYMILHTPLPSAVHRVHPSAVLIFEPCYAGGVFVATKPCVWFRGRVWMNEIFEKGPKSCTYSVWTK